MMICSTPGLNAEDVPKTEAAAGFRRRLGDGLAEFIEDGVTLEQFEPLASDPELRGCIASPPPKMSDDCNHQA